MCFPVWARAGLISGPSHLIVCIQKGSDTLSGSGANPQESKVLTVDSSSWTPEGWGITRGGEKGMVVWSWSQLSQIAHCSLSSFCERGSEVHCMALRKFLAALFIIARFWKWPKCLTMDDWLHKVWFRQTLEFYSAIKTDVMDDCLLTWQEDTIYRKHTYTYIFYAYEIHMTYVCSIGKDS